MVHANEKTKKNELTFTKEQEDLIRNTIARDATDDEFKLFIYQAQRTGLDPLARQIYFVKRGGRVIVQTSIDGFRIIAERSGRYAGQDEPVFEEKDGKLIKCTVGVYKFSPLGAGERYKAAVGVAYWDEFKPPVGQDFLWQKMPRIMLSKAAESVALRKAFPQDLSGIYTNEEMGGVDDDDRNEKEAVVVEQTSTDATGVTEKQRGKIQFERNRVGMTNERLLQFSIDLGIKDPSEMTKEEASRLIDALTKETEAV